MNSNRSNRRRGRGNRNQGGGNNANRIDSRARGNAPQLLDKYKKLAQDAQHNGDRVQAEYYLQFADHYFRVIADNKARQDEQRAKRQEERGQANDDSDDDDDGEDRRKPRRGRSQRDDRRSDSNRDDSSSEGEVGSEGAPVSDEETERKPRRSKSSETRAPRRKRAEKSDRQDGEIDAGVLPPAIGADDGEVEVETKPRRRTRAAKPADDGGEDGLKAVG